VKFARIGLLACAAIGAASASTEGPGVERLGWLAGCWSRNDAEAGSGEQWTAPGGGTMLGVSRTVRDGRTVEYEFVVIRAAQDQASTEFRLVRAGDRDVVFENAAHDFPQRVGYRLDADVRLTAWIEGSRDGATRRIPFPMRRVSCDAPPPPSR
jgi:hypothetical protein